MSDAPQLAGRAYAMPGNAAQLIARRTELARTFELSYADRAELEMVTLLLESKPVARKDVFELMLGYRHLTANAGESELQPVYDDVEKVWSRLSILLLDGTATLPDSTNRELDEGDAFAAELDAKRVRYQSWLNDVMDSLGRAIQRDLLFTTGVVKALPSDVSDDMQHNFARRLFATPYTIGYSMECQPSPGGIGFGQQSQSIFALYTFAEATLYFCNLYNEMLDQRSEEAQQVLASMRLMWMLTKGFTYSLASRGTGMTTVGLLAERSDMLDTIIKALIDGQASGAAAHTSGIAGIPLWGGQISNLSDAIQSTPTAVLIKLLRDRIEAERAHMPPL